jgi:transposase InsO family protein
MRYIHNDETIKRNYLHKYLFLINQYESIKAKSHPRFRRVGDFYKFFDIDHRSFLKYYTRFKQSSDPVDLLPQKRGPKWKTRRPIPYIENKVLALRKNGLNRYDIVHILKPKLKKNTPSPSGVYNILKRNGVNRLRPKMKQNKRRIIKEKAGELAHIDTHYLSKSLIINESQKLYLVCVVDSCTRIAWAELVHDIKALTVMFATLKCLNVIADQFDIRFAEVLTDNGPEFGPKGSSKKYGHPFERMLIEMGIKHRYTRPYRPQTNGKAERFWRTIEEDLFHETTFDSVEQIKDELLQYLVYYNHERSHQAINGKTPAEFVKISPRIT